MALRQRARNDEDKRARRASILTEAGRLLGEHAYGRITMAQVAQACGLAKGTLYLYFRSKEELFLGLLERELLEWFAALRDQLGAVPGVTAEALGWEFATSLEQRELLSNLLVILHTILEHNLDADTALAFKTTLRDQLHEAGDALETVWPALPRGSGPRVLLRMYALLIGLRQVAFPSPRISEILAREDMESMRVDFTRDLAESLRDLLSGAAQQAAAR
ncbi:MAG: TetR family transcriptional regulator [Nannocystaceae bacterium]|nr:TetR family transcriptional regulator [bacterium]